MPLILLKPAISEMDSRPLNSAGRFRFMQAEAHQSSGTPLQHNRSGSCNDSSWNFTSAMKSAEK